MAARKNTEPAPQVTEAKAASAKPKKNKEMPVTPVIPVVTVKTFISVTATKNDTSKQIVSEEITVVEELTGEEQLTNIGREKGYVTYDEILQFFPDAQNNLEQMEDVFAGLSDAGIQIVPSEDEAADQLVDDDDEDEDE